MTDERADPHDETTLIGSLARASIEFIVVEGTAGVLHGAPITTEDLDIVHRRTSENLDRLQRWLAAHGAYHRFDLSNRRLPPARESLAGSGHVNLMTDLGMLDILCELGPGEGYEELLGDTELFGALRVLSLPRLIAVKRAAGRAKDRAVLPVLIATLDEARKLAGR